MFISDEPNGVSGKHGVYGNYVFGDDVYIPEEYMDEEWAPYDSPDGYWVSTHGRVYSTLSNKFVKLKPLNLHGHLGWSAYRGKKPKYTYIHRAVAETFLDNPDNSPIVRHINDDPSDNRIENLAWGTQKENMRDAIESGRLHCVSLQKPVISTDIRSGVKREFCSLSEAARQLGLHEANISKVVLGERPMTGGYSFELMEGTDDRRVY